MESLATLYPPLSERRPIPALYQPLTFLLSLIPFFFRSRRQIGICILPIILCLCIRAPYYTFGDPSADYYSSSPFIAIPIWFLEFAILTAKEGPDAPRYVDNVEEGKKEEFSGLMCDDLRTPWERFTWAFSLMIPSHRGIGWNWQVRKVPEDPNKYLPKWIYVRRHFRQMLLAYVRSAAMLVVLGYGSTIESRLSPDSHGKAMLVNALLGWSGAIWPVGCYIGCTWNVRDLAVAATHGETTGRMVHKTNVECGVSSDDAKGKSFPAFLLPSALWLYTPIISQPALRITRLVGHSKGSLGSRYSQLYLSFLVSCLVHEFQMFSVVRRDMGEFVFFMSQPIAITLEDVVRWLWRQSTSTGTPTNSHVHLPRLAGYIWVFLWFSLSLPLYVKGCRDAGIVRDAFFGNSPFDVGARLAS
ncbi:Nn.00g107480.m01.CDS01 [Neocucurbitaria sp. VM-36]